MSEAAKRFVEELKITSRPYRVRMIHRFGGPERVVHAQVTKSALFVFWPLSGLIRITKRGGLTGCPSWRIHSEDWGMLRAEQRKLA